MYLKQYLAVSYIITRHTALAGHVFHLKTTCVVNLDRQNLFCLLFTRRSCWLPVYREMCQADSVRTMQIAVTNLYKYSSNVDEVNLKICTVNLPHIVDYEYRAIWHHWEVGRVVVRKDLHISDTHLLLRAAVQHWGKRRGSSLISCLSSPSNSGYSCWDGSKQHQWSCILVFRHPLQMLSPDILALCNTFKAY